MMNSYHQTKTMLEKYPLRQPEVKLLYHYVEKVGLSTFDVDAEVVNVKYGQLIFSAIVREYQQSMISTDDLSTLCELMYQKFENTDLFDLLLNGAEISWYIRWNPEQGAEFIRELLNQFGTTFSSNKAADQSQAFNTQTAT